MILSLKNCFSPLRTTHIIVILMMRMHSSVRPIENCRCVFVGNLFLLIILFVGLASLPSVSVLAGEVICCDLLPGETDKRESSGRWREPRLRHGAEMSQSRADTRSSESPGHWHRTAWSQSPASGRDGTIVPSLRSLRQTRLRTRVMTSATLTSRLPRCLFSLAEAAATLRGSQQLSSATLMTPRLQDRRDPRSVTAEDPWLNSRQTTPRVTPRHLTPETIITMSSLRIPRLRQFVFRMVSYFQFLVKLYKTFKWHFEGHKVCFKGYENLMLVCKRLWVLFLDLSESI